MRKPPITVSVKLGPAHLLVILPLMLIILAGCGGSETGSNATSAPADAPGNSEGDESAQILALQSAAEASLRHRSGDSYELTMTKPNAKTLYFTDSPGRNARLASARALPTWLKTAEAADGAAPNVTVTWPEALDRMPNSMVARLAGASYQRADSSLRFSLRALRLTSGEPAIVDAEPLGAEPLTRGPATIVIDGTAHRTCQLAIEPRTEREHILNLEASDLDHGEWNDPPPSSINLKISSDSPVAVIEASSDGVMTGCEFLVRYGDGNGNTVELGVDSPFIGGSSYTRRCTGDIDCTLESSDEVGDLAVGVG